MLVSSNTKTCLGLKVANQWIIGLTIIAKCVLSNIFRQLYSILPWQDIILRYTKHENQSIEQLRYCKNVVEAEAEVSGDHITRF